MIPVARIWSSFPKDFRHPTLDVYRAFQGRLMVDLSHAVSPLIKYCTAIILNEERRMTNSIQKGEERNLWSVRKLVYSACNRFLKDVESSSVGYDLHLVFSK